MGLNYQNAHANVRFMNSLLHYTTSLGILNNLGSQIWGYISVPLEGLASVILIGFIIFGFVHGLHEEGSRGSIWVQLGKSGATLLIGIAVIFIFFGPVASTLGL